MLQTTSKFTHDKAPTHSTTAYDLDAVEENTVFFTIEDEIVFDDLNIINSSRRNNTTYEYNFRPIIKDNLLKKTLNVAYCKRYFVLTNSRLLYYSNETMA